MNLKKNLEEKQYYGENSFSFVNQSLLQPFLHADVILSNGWTKYNQKQQACLSLYGGRDLKTKETNKQKKREGSDFAEKD